MLMRVILMRGMTMAKKPTAMQIVVYDVGDNSLPDRVVRELEETVVRVLSKHTTIAHTVVTE
jgi:hypothetical protein